MSFFKTGKPFIIAGPCSAETREQVLETAAGVAGLNIDLFRAGVWKPRTRPGSFEGNGEQALQWMQEAKAQYRLKYTVEVAEPAHIELALKYGADALWVGARTTVNPFHIQHLADALKGINIPVLVKNPVNPDIELWVGAIERFMAAGIIDLAAVHRGFSGYSAAIGYRNQPNWPIPIELKRRMPDLPVICDPSHISGKRARIADVAQKALDMHFDGLMIETHVNPDDAWTDARQQITPAQLAELLNKLVIREEFTTDMGSQVQLEYLRQQMDAVDTEIIDLLAKRLELSEKVADIKKSANMTVYQPSRWREIIDTVTSRCDITGLDKDFVLALYEKIHHESIQRQLQVLGNARIEIKK